MLIFKTIADRKTMHNQPYFIIIYLLEYFCYVWEHIKLNINERNRDRLDKTLSWWSKC